MKFVKFNVLVTLFAFLLIVNLTDVNAQAAENTSDKTAAHSQPQGILPIPEYGGDLANRSYLTGDWGGKRTEWANIGG